MRAAREMHDAGTFTYAADAAKFAEVSELLRGP